MEMTPEPVTAVTVDNPDNRDLDAPWHTLILLTKAPWNTVRWAMPDNVWLGATVTGGLANEQRRLEAVAAFQARVRWLSCEPLEGPVDPTVARPDWLVIGAATGAGGFRPDEAWVRGLEDYADAHAIPIYHTTNLKIRPEKRREWPDEQRRASTRYKHIVGGEAW